MAGCTRIVTRWESKLGSNATDVISCAVEMKRFSGVLWLDFYHWKGGPNPRCHDEGASFSFKEFSVYDLGVTRSPSGS